MPETHASRTTHHPALAHHFDDLEQQHEAATLGMWVFLRHRGAVLRRPVRSPTRSTARWYPDAFAAASHELDVALGTHQHRRPHHQQPDDGAGGPCGAARRTPAAADAVPGADDGARRRVPRHQGVEYYTSSSSTTSRARTSSSRPKYFRHAQIFFSLYFVMTGLHALHMIIGLGIMTSLACSIGLISSLNRREDTRAPSLPSPFT